MFLVLTALAILPADLADNELTKHQALLGMHVRQCELLIQKTQRTVDQLQKELPLRPGLRLIIQARLDDLGRHQKMLIRAHNAEVNGPPFAAAIWLTPRERGRVGAAPRK